MSVSNLRSDEKIRNSFVDAFSASLLAGTPQLGGYFSWKVSKIAEREFLTNISTSRKFPLRLLSSCTAGFATSGMLLLANKILIFDRVTLERQDNILFTAAVSYVFAAVCPFFAMSKFLLPSYWAQRSLLRLSGVSTEEARQALHASELMYISMKDVIKIVPIVPPVVCASLPLMDVFDHVCTINKRQ